MSGWAYRGPAIPVPQPDDADVHIGLRDHVSAGGGRRAVAGSEVGHVGHGVTGVEHRLDHRSHESVNFSHVTLEITKYSKVVTNCCETWEPNKLIPILGEG
jgi:hypothetical protein